MCSFARSAAILAAGAAVSFIHRKKSRAEANFSARTIQRALEKLAFRVPRVEHVRARNPVSPVRPEISLGSELYRA